MDEWKKLIVILVRIRSQLMEADKEKLWEYHLPVATSRTDMDLFVMVLKTGRKFGEIIWLAGGEIDRFESFKDFFKSMIEYNRLDLEDAKNGV